MKSKLKNNRGVTLIELIIVLALITVIIAVTTNIFVVSRKTFATGVDKSSVQQDVRFTSNRIIDELKFAKEIAGTSAGISNKTNGYYKISLVNSNISIQKYTSAGAETGAPQIVGNYIQSLNFVSETTDKVVKFDITATSGEQDFIVNSSVQPMNITQLNITATPVLYYSLHP